MLNSDLINETLRKEKLIRNKLQHPLIKEIRGKGLMLAAIFKTPEIAQEVVMHCLDHGLILFFLLFEKKATRITPPLTISDEEIEEGCQIIISILNTIETK
jgi:4-aminobutyrate aminotransferase-like enzyme